MKRLFHDNNKVLLQMQLNPVKYQAVKKEGFNSEEAAETIQKKSKRLLHLRCQCYKKHDIISSLVSLGTLVGLLGTVAGMIKAFGALAAAGTPDQAALAAGISEALNTATGIGTSAVAIISYNFFTSKLMI
jgi:biopolymer transport protein ExbB